MKTYQVSWVIDIDAESHLEAARQAHKIQVDPKSTALVYGVREVLEYEVSREEKVIDLWDDI